MRNSKIQPPRKLGAWAQKIMNDMQAAKAAEATKQLSGSDINLEGLKKGIAHVESADGVLMMNPNSSATGLYGQLFNEQGISDIYKGTRKEFAKDIGAQNKVFEKRLYKGIGGNSLLKDAQDLRKEYSPQIEGFDKMFSTEDLIVLDNFLGRQGTRKYLGNVIRDNKSLAEVFPHLYGQNVAAPNHTPEQYLAKARPYYISGKNGGQLMKPKNIPMYYDFSGTPIYRDTTSLLFRYGGRMKNYYDVGGPVDGISEETSKQLLNAPIIGKVNYVPKSRNFTPGFVQGPTLDAYNKAREEKEKSASSLKTAKTELEEEQKRIDEGIEKMMGAAERALSDEEYNKVFKYKLPYGSFYCQTRNCELDRIAGFTTVKDTNLFGKNIPAGSLMEVTPGIGSFVRKADAFGYVPVNYEDRKRGDVAIMRSFSNDPAHLGVHSIRYAGDDTYYEDHGSGYFYDKTKNRSLANPLFFRYVGNTPALQTKVGEAEKE